MIEVISDRLKYKIKKERILYIESRRNGSLIHALHNDFKNRISLSMYEEELKKDGFIRAHESYLVNLHYVKELQKTKVVLINGDEVLVSRRQKKYVLEGLKKLNESHEKL